MISPYQSGGGAPSFGPPPGLAGIMAGREHNQALARQGASRNIGTLLEYLQSAGDQKKRDATEATTLRKLMDDVYDPEGKEDRKINGASLDTLRAGVAKVGAQAAMQAAMAEAKSQKQTALLNALKLRAGESELAAEERFGSMAQGLPLQRALNEGRGPIKPGPTTIEDLLQAARSNPTAPSARPLMQDLLNQTGSVMPVPANVGGRNLIVNPKSGAFQDVTPQPAPQIPAGLVPLGAVEDEDGSLKIRYGFPKAEGKALTQTEVASIAALNQAEMDLNALEKIYEGLGPGYGGPVSGRVKSFVMGGQNPNIAEINNAITAATPNMARGVFREVGVLTDMDREVYKQLLPAPTDTQEVRNRKIKYLRGRIANGRKEMVTSLKAAGRDVEGFSAEGSKSATPTRFDSEDAARASGAKAGDVFELYDPATATYRKARLK